MEVVNITTEDISDTLTLKNPFFYLFIYLFYLFIYFIYLFIYFLFIYFFFNHFALIGLDKPIIKACHTHYKPP